MDENRIDLEAFRFALENFAEGMVFENFAHGFLSTVLGSDFIPVGGTKDRGIDGLKRVFSRTGFENIIYQISTELSYETKIEDSITKLQSNSIIVNQLIYVTNRKVQKKEQLEDSFLTTHDIPLKIFDIEWFATNLVANQALIKLYDTFINSNIHEFRNPNKVYVATDFVADPRLYVFLRQQFDVKGRNSEIESILAETLILYSLEGTSSDEEIFKNSEEIKANISSHVKFNVVALYDTIDTQLQILCKKPNQKINYHKAIDSYCLPFETSLELKERDIIERKLTQDFQDETGELLKHYLGEESVKIQNALTLIEETIHKIFHKQGLEFSAFVLDGESRDLVEIGLEDIINGVVDNSSVVIKNKQKVKRALLMTIRNIIYNGSIAQKTYLTKLSSTYNMMFMLKWAPQLATSFQKMASQLKIYVGNSIIIPALSEIYLDKQNKRHWNLLVEASNVGVTLIINDTILNELESHFYMLKSKYNKLYKETEDLYLDDELMTLYVQEIMIRAYFYSKSKSKVSNFKDFIDNFINPNFRNVKQDIATFLYEEFNIRYESTTEVESKIDSYELLALTEKLTPMKGTAATAESDAKLMLAVYKIRELNNEIDGKNLFGYKSWWLSKDINTHSAMKDLFNDKYNVNCYMRADFLYNYIAYAPKKAEIDNMFKQIFPGLIGVNLSYHLPKEFCQHVNKSILEHNESSPSKIKRMLKSYTEKLMTSELTSSKELVSFYDEELKKTIQK